jgi:DNA helicase II / ATP-dependent DNA helicase PcrA
MTESDFSFLNELNEAQRKAVEHTEGPSMILAGAGSGKTRVLTYRIALLMKKGVDPFHILALTFTNKAAREMKARIARIVGESDAKGLWMGTFHSVFSRILRFESELIGYPKNFTIYDSDDSKSLLREIIKSMNLDDKVYKPSFILSRISTAKNNLISPKQYMSNSMAIEEDRLARIPLFSQIFITYQKRLFKASAMDFDDLLFNTNLLLRDHPKALYKYQEKFRYILVDEYQDTNFSQYVIIRQLAAAFQNICVVGDDAQSIYAFRGANIQNILNFEKDYPELVTFKLEQNYRSTKNIVEAANQVINNNKEQFKKSVWTQNETGEKITVIRASTDNEEGQKVAAAIFQYKNNERVLNSAFAVLYRTNAQSRSIEEALRKMNIPYRIYGGLSFYQRKEVKDLMAYFRLAINQHDDESLRRIINYPARGIGQSTLDKLSVAAGDNDISIFTAIEHVRDFNLGINAGTLSRLSDFLAMIRSFQQQLLQKDAYEVAHTIAVASGILKDLHSDKTPEGVSRYENIMELLNGIKDFVENTRSPQDEELKSQEIYPSTPDPSDLFDVEEKDLKGLRTLDEFMMDVALLTDADQKEDDKADKVILMTIHAAKGLEFPYVFIVGMEENLFPSQLSLQSRTELEEERRLFYVALTRAERKATLSYALVRYRFGKVTHCEPSRFLDELSQDFIELTDTTSRVRFSDDAFDSMRDAWDKPANSSLNFKNQKKDNRNQTVFSQLNIQREKKMTPVNSVSSRSSSANLDESVIKQITIGVLVEHEKFGRGKVVSLEGNFPDVKATVLFATAGQKMLLLKFARLKVIG